jgi:hypothetical protein
MAEKIELRITKKPDEIVKIQTEIDDFRYRYDLDDESIYKLNFVLESLIMRFIKVAESSEETLIIKFTVFEDDIMIHLIDSGSEFNPLEVKNTDLNELVLQDDYVSLGIILSQDYMVDPEYSREEDKNLIQLFVEVEEDF